ncbi:MAG: ribonuclease E inhibitor RraB [Rhodoglobus sp.]
MDFFKRRAKIESFGNDLDDLTLRELSKRSDLALPRHWIHYVCCADEAGARTVAAASVHNGWDIKRVDGAADGEGWIASLERHDVVVSPAAVRDARHFFEQLTATLPGSFYDGWEASA